MSRRKPKPWVPASPDLLGALGLRNPNSILPAPAPPRTPDVVAFFATEHEAHAYAARRYVGDEQQVHVKGQGATWTVHVLTDRSST